MIKNLQHIYMHLEDELSKEIYMDRLGYSVSGNDRSFIDRILDRTVRISPSWEKLQEISIYHKPEDITTLPECILDIHEEYRLYLRHYSFSWYDMVLYAIPEDL